MNNKTTPLKMAIVGAGGSGTSVQRALLTNPNIFWEILLGVDDSGGSTGVVTKVFQRINLKGFGASDRFNDRRRILPIGDTRNNILRILNYTPGKEQIAKLLDKRLDDSLDLKTEVINAFREVINELNISTEILGGDFFNQFELFIEEYLRVYYKYKEDILLEVKEESNFQVDKLKDLSVGNIFLMFFFLTSNSTEAFFDRLKEIGIVPENINFQYISEFRHILLARNNEGDLVVGEHNVDESTRPLLPSEFYLCPVDANGKPNTIINKKGEVEYDILQPEYVQKQFNDILQTMDTIFLSTGSYANLFTQVNLLSDVLTEFKGLMMYVSNFARTMNEVHSQFAIDRLYKVIKKQFITLLVNDELSADLFSDKKIRRRYRSQKKSFNEADEVFDYLRHNIKDQVFLERILPILNLIHGNETTLDLQAEDFVDKGIKHEPNEIADITIFFTIIYKLMDMYELDTEAKEILFNGLVTNLRIKDFQNTDLQEYVRFLREISTSNISPDGKVAILTEIQRYFELEKVNIVDYINDFRSNRLPEFH